jgi:DHA1 family bicyclomycin/chloramphenicol resistance-like MFS transporter
VSGRFDGDRALWFTLILGLLTAVGPLTVDLYLPAFPAVAAELHATEGQIQITLAGTTVGLAVGQLLVGALSDRIGRLPPLLVGIGIHVGSCVLAAAAPTVEILTIARIVMGAAAAASGVMALAMVRDRFTGMRMVRMIATLGAINGFAPIAAPVIGSQLLLATDWRGIFVFLGVYAVLVGMLVLIALRETLPLERRARRPGALRASLGVLAHDRIFLGLLAVGGAVWGSEFAYLASSPFVFQGGFGFSAVQYGILFAVNAAGYVAGTQVGARLAPRVPPQWTLTVALAVMAGAAAAVAVLTLAAAGAVAIAIPIWFSVAAVGACVPSVQVLALAPHGERTGLAASLVGASSFGIAGAVTLVPGLFVDVQLGMAITMATSSAVGLAAMLIVVRPRRVPPLVR